MTKTATLPATLIAKVGDVKIVADQGSHRVELGVAGKSAVMTAEHADAVGRKLREASRFAS